MTKVDLCGDSLNLKALLVILETLDKEGEAMIVGVLKGSAGKWKHELKEARNVQGQ